MLDAWTTPMLDYITLRDVGPAASMTVNFAERLTLLTGDNGAGKTFVLDIAWWALTRTWSDREAFPHRGKGVRPEIEYRVIGKRGPAAVVSAEFDFQRQTWKLPARRPAMPGLVIYVRVDGSFSVWDPARNYWKEAASLGVHAPDRPSAFHFDRRAVWDGLSVGENIICNGLIRDWVHWQLQRSAPFEALCSVLRTLSLPEEPALRPGAPMRVSLDDARDIPTVELAYGVVPVTHLSAGMRRILALAYLLVWAREEHAKASELLNQEPDSRLVVLFDEVETHLHPRWQRVILPALIEATGALSPGMTVQCIASTHAPLVMASAEPLFDTARDRAFDLDVRGSEVVVSEIEWRLRGDANAWLTSRDVFGLGYARSVPAEDAIRAAAEAVHRLGGVEVISSEDRAELYRLHQELGKQLSDLDPFWLRWFHFADRHGVLA